PTDPPSVAGTGALPPVAMTSPAFTMPVALPWKIRPPPSPPGQVVGQVAASPPGGWISPLLTVQPLWRVDRFGGHPLPPSTAPSPPCASTSPALYTGP